MWAYLTQIVSGIDYVVMIVVLVFDDDAFYLDTLVVVTILRLQSFLKILKCSLRYIKMAVACFTYCQNV